MKEDDMRKNASGCFDPTAYIAIKNNDREEERFLKLLYAIFDICDLSGFKLEGRITLIDKESGKTWK